MEYLATAIVVLLFVVAIVFFRNFLKDGNVKRTIQALPAIMAAVSLFIKQADRIHDQILLEYAERAEEEGMDARLLWVIDQTENYVKAQFGFEVDLNWLIALIEDFVQKIKVK